MRETAQFDFPKGETAIHEFLERRLDPVVGLQMCGGDLVRTVRGLFRAEHQNNFR